MKKREIILIVEKAMCHLIPVSGDIEYCGYIDGKDDFYKELKETLGYVGAASSIGDFAVNMGYVWFPGNRKWISKENTEDSKR